MTKVFSRGMILAAGLLATSGTAVPDLRLAHLRTPQDPRLVRVRNYFAAREFPAHVLAEDFIHAADQNELDWRLLPSLAIVESGGGREARSNNMFGWANGERGFASPREGIYLVASRLRHSDLYRDKDLDRLLWTYNPVEGYADRVKAVMRQLGDPEFVPEPVF
jgi:hypothetical protein